MPENIPLIYKGIFLLVAAVIGLLAGMAVDRAKHRNQPRCGPGCRRELDACNLMNKKLTEAHAQELNYAYREVAHYKILADKLQAQLDQVRA